jgi:hypothetical protein
MGVGGLSYALNFYHFSVPPGVVFLLGLGSAILIVISLGLWMRVAWTWLREKGLQLGPFILGAICVGGFIIAVIWGAASWQLPARQNTAGSEPTKEERLLSHTEQSVRSYIAPDSGGPLLPYFVRDHPGYRMMLTAFPVRENEHGHPIDEKKIPVIVYLDLEHNSYFGSIYIPPQPHLDDSINIATLLAGNYGNWFKQILAPFTLAAVSPTGGVYDSKAIRFTGRVYLYLDDPISDEDAARLTLRYAQHGALLDLRRRSYADLRQAQDAASTR